MIDSIKSTDDIKNLADSLKSEINNIFVGNPTVVDSLLISILVGGHVLIEGLPGTGKTLLATLFSNSIESDSSRIQSTSDLMPSDITGTRIYNPKSREFEFRSGPVFSNFVLVDEINRAPPKTQSALLECMQEGQVTIDGNTTVLEQPFMIIATKNPIEFAGTFPLPPAQLDRFMSRLIMNYPRTEAWIDILEKKNERGEIVDINPILDGASVLSARKIIDEQVSISDDVYKFIADLCSSTRDTSSIILGASPTASVSLLNAARGYAAVINGKDSVTIDDVKAVAFDVLNHRLVVKQSDITDYVETEGDFSIEKIISDILESASGE